MAQQESIYQLENQLADLAYQWRSRQAQDPALATDDIVQQYHHILKRLWERGWHTNLDATAELPRELMPEEYFRRGDAMP